MPPKTERFLIDSFKDDDISFFEPISNPRIPSKQIKKYREDEMDIDRIYQEDLEKYESSQKGLEKQDLLAEESFEKLFNTENISNNANVRGKMLESIADYFVEGDYSNEEKQDIYKERLHNLWSDLGKPLIEFSDTPKHADWKQGDRKDFVQPIKWLNPPEVEFDEIKPFTPEDLNELSDIDIFEKAFIRHGKAERHDSWGESNKYRQDKIRINDEEKANHRWRYFLDELTHQMQGRKLHGDDVRKIRLAAGRQDRIEDEYQNPRTLEHQAHGVYAPMLRKYLKGDDQYIDIIKSGNWGSPNTDYKHFKHESLGLPKIVADEYK